MKTPAQRKAEERQRRKAAGLIRFEAWINPGHRAKVVKFIEGLKK